MSVYVPPEIQETVFSYLMYSSGKGSEFNLQILESWDNINLKPVDRALDTLSQDNNHRELVKLFLAIDAEISNLHFHKKEMLNKARIWAVGYYNLSLSGLNFMNRIRSFHQHFITCVITRDDNRLFGYLLLKEELYKSEVQNLLNVSKYSDLNLFPADLISYKDQPLHHYINADNVFHATLGDAKLLEQTSDKINKIFQVNSFLTMNPVITKSLPCVWINSYILTCTYWDWNKCYL